MKNNDSICEKYLYAWVGYDKRSICLQSLADLNSELSFSKTGYHTKVKKPREPFYLLITGGRIVGFIPFPRALGLCEMQIALPRIWTRFNVSISKDENYYTTAKLRIWWIKCMHWWRWSSGNFNWFLSHEIYKHVCPKKTIKCLSN